VCNLSPINQRAAAAINGASTHKYKSADRHWDWNKKNCSRSFLTLLEMVTQYSTGSSNRSNGAHVNGPFSITYFALREMHSVVDVFVC